MSGIHNDCHSCPDKKVLSVIAQVSSKVHCLIFIPLLPQRCGYLGITWTTTHIASVCKKPLEVYYYI